MLPVFLILYFAFTIGIFYIMELVEEQNKILKRLIIRQYNNIDLSSEVSTVHKFVYTDEALLLVRQ
jgi:hypothetical protein